jgi:hypothetical protein
MARGAVLSMKKFAIIATLLLLLLIVGCHLLAGPLYYRAPAMTATVIDEETGKPLEGVVAVQQWVLHLWPGLGFEYAIDAVEAVTGPDGAFHFPAWGPRLRPPFKVLTYQDPMILLMKPGYYVWQKDNHQAYVPVFHTAGARGSTYGLRPDQRPEVFPGDYETGAVRVSYWNAKVIPLEPARDMKRYAASLHLLDFPADAHKPLPRLAKACEQAMLSLPSERDLWCRRLNQPEEK